MNTASSHIDILISRKVSGEATPSEIEELNLIVAHNDDARKQLQGSMHAWEKSRHPLSKEEIQVDHKKVKEQIAKRDLASMEKRKSLRLLFRVAAILAVPVLLTIGWYAGIWSLSNREYALCEVSAPKGQIAECLLADGTRVWLNAGTTIQYDPLLRAKDRRVNLKGEAYFKVTKKPHKPFIVNTTEVEVKVLGTSFNVKAYPGEKQTETTLDEGQVSLKLKNDPGKDEVFLKPGERAVFQSSAKSFIIETTDTYLHTSWRDGKYIFKDADLNTVVRQLEKLYDVKIYLKDSVVGQTRFRCTFESNQDILAALESLERITSLKYRIKGREIWLE